MDHEEVAKPLEQDVKNNIFVEAIENSFLWTVNGKIFLSL